jgi:hypothetical protein
VFAALASDAKDVVNQAVKMKKASVLIVTPPVTG